MKCSTLRWCVYHMKLLGKIYPSWRFMFVLWPAILLISTKHIGDPCCDTKFVLESLCITYVCTYSVRCRFPTDFLCLRIVRKHASLRSVSKFGMDVRSTEYVVSVSKLHEQEPCYRISNTNIQNQIQNNACHSTNNKSRLTSYMHKSWNMIHLFNSITDICQIVNFADHRSCVYLREYWYTYYYVMCDMIHHRTQGRITNC